MLYINFCLFKEIPSLQVVSLSLREFEMLYQDREHVEVAHKAAQEASRQAMTNPRRFSRPSVLSALAIAMVPSLSVAIRWEEDPIS